jgi:ABC-2 type transport system permease protein
MSDSLVMRKLILKDLYLNRWLLLGAVVAGVASLVMMSWSRLGYTIGNVCYITTIVALGIVLAMYGILQERKDRSFLFALSLPLSTAQYVRSKTLGALATFLIPWTLLSVGSVVLNAASPAIADGMIPVAIITSLFFLANFCIVIAAVFAVSSDALVAGVVIVTNMCVTFFIILVNSVPAIARDMKVDAVVWNTPTLLILAIEILTISIMLAIPFFVHSRKRDFT